MKEINDDLTYKIIGCAMNVHNTLGADFIVENAVLIELKAVIKLEDVHLAQGLNYLQAYKIEKGLLIKFGAPALEVKRLFRKHKRAIYSLAQSNPDHP